RIGTWVSSPVAGRTTITVTIPTLSPTAESTRGRDVGFVGILYRAVLTGWQSPRDPPAQRQQRGGYRPRSSRLKTLMASLVSTHQGGPPLAWGGGGVPRRPHVA